jgi:hypothetical protein
MIRMAVMSVILKCCGKFWGRVFFKRMDLGVAGTL